VDRIRVLGHKKPIVLSPLAGITVPPFRRLCAESGADITISEMTFVRGLLNYQRNSLKRIQRSVQEKNFGIQLLTNDENDLSEVLNLIESNKMCNFIELNLGCPEFKIVSKGLGAALLRPKLSKELENLLEITDSSNLPFSLKIRAGFNRTSFNSVLNKAEQYNISFVTLHGRLAKDSYAQPAQKKFWLEAVRETSIPIIANGDIKNKDEAEELMDKTDISGVAIGRASRGNPQIFSEANIPSLKVYDQLIKYFQEEQYYTPLNVKIHSLDFLKRFKYATRARKKLTGMKNIENVVKLTRKYLSEQNDNFNRT
jgi:tRNA-dihydrouridine synthase B